MPLYYSRGEYTFSADAHSLTIEPGPRPITLQRWELERLGLAVRDDYRVPADDERKEAGLIAEILSALTEALTRCEGPRLARTRRNVRRAMALVGGMDEKMARGILEADGD